MTTSLETQATGFAEGLSATMRAVVGAHCPPFRVVAVKDLFTVSQVPEKGIVLAREGAPLVTLAAEYLCSWDRAGEFLKVLKSQIALYVGAEAGGVPLFRYEYERKMARSLPDAHLHVHEDPGHESRITQLLRNAGTGTRRARRRRKGFSDTRADLHFPLGGDRFRPTLEDILQTLIEELGVDAEPGWEDSLADAREEWRRTQIRAAVRDDPSMAVAVLERAGYSVTPPPEGHPLPNSRAMREL